MWNQSPVFSRMKRHQLGGVAELARRRQARGQVAAQRHDVADAVRLVFLDHLERGPARGSHARQVRRRRVAVLADLEHGGERALARRAARAVGDGEEIGLRAARAAAAWRAASPCPPASWAGRTRSWRLAALRPRLAVPMRLSAPEAPRKRLDARRPVVHRGARSSRGRRGPTAAPRRNRPAARAREGGMHAARERGAEEAVVHAVDPELRHARGARHSAPSPPPAAPRRKPRRGPASRARRRS